MAGRVVSEPKWRLEELQGEGFAAEDVFFIGCVSYEERCRTAAKRIFGSTDNPTSAAVFLEIDDDECTFPSWRERCRTKLSENRERIETLLNEKHVRKLNAPLSYRMSERREHTAKLRSDIEEAERQLFPDGRALKCILDVTCMPSYFFFQLVKYLLYDERVADLIVSYTKPEDYPSEEPLKVSPFDKTKPEFLPSFVTDDVLDELLNRHRKIGWIVCVGFDYDSVKNAERIRDILNIDAIDIVIPFPAYRPEYVVRTMKENQDLLRNNQHFSYAPADNPFRTFQKVNQLIGNSHNFALSTFGPKPMALGFCMSAISTGIPIIHVQATNYNPDFSRGESETFVYWLKYRTEFWWNCYFGCVW